MSDAPDSKTPGTVPSKPGVMTVLSTMLYPESLDPLDFCKWYEDTHIQEVQATGGISWTQRYESLSFRSRDGQNTNTSVENQNCNYNFITVYHMPDLAFRESAAFRGLAGQSVPNDELVEKIFKQAEFCTRFCEEVETTRDTSSTLVPSYLVTIGVRSVGVPSSHSVANLLSMLSQLPGKARTATYKVHEASVLSAFKRSYLKEPSDMVLIDFESEPDTNELLITLREWEGLEIGFWCLRRSYDGGEQTPATWKPK